MSRGVFNFYMKYCTAIIDYLSKECNTPLSSFTLLVILLYWVFFLLIFINMTHLIYLLKEWYYREWNKINDGPSEIVAGVDVFKVAALENTKNKEKVPFDLLLCSQ